MRNTVRADSVAQLKPLIVQTVKEFKGFLLEVSQTDDQVLQLVWEKSCLLSISCKHRHMLPLLQPALVYGGSHVCSRALKSACKYCICSHTDCICVCVYANTQYMCVNICAYLSMIWGTRGVNGRQIEGERVFLCVCVPEFCQRHLAFLKTAVSFHQSVSADWSLNRANKFPHITPTFPLWV